ncbi:peptidase M16 [Alicyclobacillus hesperidum subsp. aegles]|uniref:EF-P 5-aminopentanol modification-associated protein YfmF n=1 Tax=Alicyclobacillus hesperidum TaxID=89784 RepID=UPI00068A8B3F|nr:pitrilysin family protein [Alicyclobacillus hesperidum]GLG00070.1 peptidase M16 [Alicyclobacillus hesperidum subsp. aegles]
MESFQTLSAGRCHVHILPHAGFRTKEVSIRLHVRMDRQHVTPYALLPHMWMNGTDKLPSTRSLTTACDNLYGASVRTSLGKRGGYHILEVSASIPDVSFVAEDSLVERALDLLCDVLFDHTEGHGCFDDALVRRELDLHRRRIEAARDEKMSFALQRCFAIACEGTPAALPRLGFVEDLPKLNASQLFRAYEELLQNAEAHAYIVGPFDDLQSVGAALLQRLTEKMIGGSAVPVEREVLPRPESRSVREVTEYDDIHQSQLDLAYITGVGYADPEYPALLMMNGVFGGFAHSKLFIHVRERHSLAYTVWSHVDQATGMLAVMTGISPEKREQALTIIEQQLNDLRDGKIADEELEYTYRSLRNQYTVLLDQPAALANWHHQGIMCGRQRDIDELLTDLERVTRDDITKVAQAIEMSTLYFLTRKDEA